MLGASPGEATVGGKRYGAKPTVKTYVRNCNRNSNCYCSPPFDFYIIQIQIEIHLHNDNANHTDI